MTETAFLLGEPATSVAVLTTPDESPSPGAATGTGAIGTSGNTSGDHPAIVLVNSGIIHRPGPNRLYVKIARRLAAHGFTVLRFDLSGIGDSDVRPGAEPFLDRAVRETREAMDWLERERGLRHFLLAGLCSGAVISYRTTRADERVVGAVLINGGGYFEGTDTEEVVARTLAHHYRRMTFSSSFRLKNWKKALRGNVDYKSILKIAIGAPKRVLGGIVNVFKRHDSDASDAGQNDGTDELTRLQTRGVRLLALHSEGDDGLDYMRVVLGAKIAHWEAEGVMSFVLVPEANHTFTLLWSQQRLLDEIERWVTDRWVIDRGRGEARDG